MQSEGVGLTYTPDTNFNGTDSFTLMITDDEGNAENQGYKRHCKSVNDAAIFGGDTTGTVAEDTTITGTVTVTVILIFYHESFLYLLSASTELQR